MIWRPNRFSLKIVRVATYVDQDNFYEKSESDDKTIEQVSQS